MRLYLEFNMWLLKNMNKLFLWLVIVGITTTSLYYYEYVHPMSAIMYWMIILLLVYLEYKIILY